ncbi:SRSF protein kinase 3-like isoform X2 [Mytilus californianus]|uniref:SRSF protein kinase 3-like isoform X2 n=1 Tax=Mytilus californianus TaxID=6549 RepID=UPI00224506B9|nr:SRSF protein kinase 3-like isoform X2 [Mytilus californianus]
MSDFRERYNHYMEMYRLVPPSEVGRRVSWTGGNDYQYYDNQNRHHRRSTGSLELCNQVDNFIHQVHHAKQMLRQSSLFNIENNNRVNDDYLRRLNSRHHSHFSGKPPNRILKTMPQNCADSIPIHLSSQNSQSAMSSEFRQTLDRWRSSKRRVKQSSHEKKDAEKSFHHHIALNWDNLYSSSDIDSDSQSDMKNKYKSHSEYGKGGYHPVKIGDLFNNKYHVIRKLGWGHFSTVWLCWDMSCKRFVALKVVKSAQHYTETALDEIKLLKCVRESDESDDYRERTVQLLDDFKISGINGTHVCMVFEVLGNNLLKLIIRSNYQGIPVRNVKSIIKQVLQGLHYLHVKCKIIHTDIKPENVLMCVDDTHVRKLAADAFEWQKIGCPMPGSAVSTAPKEKPDTSKMSKNKKKKMKKKLKKQQQLLEMTQSASINTFPEGNPGGEGMDQTDQDNTETSDLPNSETSSLNMPSSESSNLISPISDSSNLISPTSESSNPLPNSESTVPSSDASPVIEQANITKNDSEITITESDNNNKVKEKNIVNETKTENANEKENNVEHNSTEMCQPDIIDLNIKEVESKLNVENEKKSVEEGQQNSEVVHDAGDVPMCNGFESQNGDVNTNFSSKCETAMDQEVPQEEAQDNRGNRRSHSPSSQTPSDKTDSSSGKANAARPDPVREECDIPVKIADLGNACWTYHRFTEDIQTRQYRCLEVLIGAGYGPPADIWSTACMAFELIVGDYLFEPHSGEDYSRDEDHIAHIIELLGPIPRHIALAGKYSREFFNRRGELKHILKLKPWALTEVLQEKYEWTPEEAAAFGDFIVPMLEFDPEKRATAEECLQHPWLNDV